MALFVLCHVSFFFFFFSSFLRNTSSITLKLQFQTPFLYEIFTPMSHQGLTCYLPLTQRDKTETLNFCAMVVSNILYSNTKVATKTLTIAVQAGSDCSVSIQ